MLLPEYFAITKNIIYYMKLSTVMCFLGLLTKKTCSLGEKNEQFYYSENCVGSGLFLHSIVPRNYLNIYSLMFSCLNKPIGQTHFNSNRYFPG